MILPALRVCAMLQPLLLRQLRGRLSIMDKQKLVGGLLGWGLIHGIFGRRIFRRTKKISKIPFHYFFEKIIKDQNLQLKIRNQNVGMDF